MQTTAKLLFMFGFLFVLGNGACTSSKGNDGDGGVGDGGSDSDTDADTDTDTDTDSDSDSDTDSDTDGGNICESLNVDADPLPPRVIILQDLSSSLYYNDSWDSLVLAMTQVVDTYNLTFALGLVPFPTTYFMEPGPDRHDDDCTVDTDHVIGPAVGNATAIKNKVYNIVDSTLIGGTPTHEGFVVSRELLVDQDPGDGSKRVIILVTDGEPNCLEEGSASEAQTRVTNDIIALHDDDAIDIYVVGYDLSSGLTDVMNTWADEGGTGSHYPANDAPSLLAQMDTIAADLVPCEYTLEETVPDPTYVRVQIDLDSKPYNDPDGWTLGDDDLTITLNGASCDLLRDGDSHDLKITVECEAVIIE